jgi:hypothetical protein
MLHVKLPLDTRRVMQDLAALGEHGVVWGGLSEDQEYVLLSSVHANVCQRVSHWCLACFQHTKDADTSIYCGAIQ